MKMKKFMQFIVSVAGSFAVCALFYAFSPVHYTNSGTVGETSGFGVAASVVFCALFFAAAFICGRLERHGCAAGFGAVTAYACAAGMAGYYGYATVFHGVMTSFYILIAPLTPLIERIIYSGTLYDADRAILTIPAAVFLTAGLFYIAGVVWKKASMARKKSEAGGRSISYIPRLIKLFGKGRAS